MKVFVTGGSGFIGGHVIEALISAQHEVLAMARSDRSAATIESLGAAAVQCSLDDVEAAHLEGVDAVVHCAAFVEEYGTRAQFFKANVDGTARVLDAAQRAQVARFVHMGTEAAVFDGTPLQNVDEDAPYPAKHRFLYSESKAAAERLVLERNRADFTTISLRPRFVWGPRDASILPAVQRIATEGQWVWVDGGRAQTSTTHIENLAHAVLLSLERGRGGRAYFVSDDEVWTIRDFLTQYLATAGVALQGPSLPGAALRPLARSVEAVWRALGITKPPPMTGFAIAAMSRTVTVSISRARKELRYSPKISVQEGLSALRTA